MLEIILLIVFAPIALNVACQILAAIFNPLFNRKKKYNFRSVSDPGPTDAIDVGSEPLKSKLTTLLYCAIVVGILAVPFLIDGLT